MGDQDDEHGPPTDEALTPSRTSRERLRVSARELLAQATLDDLTAFITVRRLAEHAGLSSGAVYSAYEPEAGDGSRIRSAPQVVARLAFGDLEPSNHDRSLRRRAALVDHLREAAGEGEVGVLEAFADELAGIIAWLARGEDDHDGWSFTQVFLGAGVSPHDDGITRYMKENLDRRDGFMVTVVNEVLAVSGREPVDGVGTPDIARMLVSATIGGAMRVRVDPTADPGFIARTCLTVIASLTRRADARDERFGHRLTADQPALSEAEATAVREAVIRVHARAGWPAVNLAKVSQLTGISDARLAGVHGSRHALAAMAWDEVVVGLERRAVAHAGQGAPDRLAAFVEDLVDVICANRYLLASLLIDRLERTVNRAVDEVDPGTDRLASLLGGLVADAAVAAGEGSEVKGAFQVGDLDGPVRMARSMLDGIFLRATDSSVTPQEISVRVSGWLNAAGVVR